MNFSSDPQPLPYRFGFACWWVCSATGIRSPYLCIYRCVTLADRGSHPLLCECQSVSLTGRPSSNRCKLICLCLPVAYLPANSLPLLRLLSPFIPFIYPCSLRVRLLSHKLCKDFRQINECCNSSQEIYYIWRSEEAKGNIWEMKE